MHLQAATKKETSMSEMTVRYKRILSVLQRDINGLRNYTRGKNPFGTGSTPIRRRENTYKLISRHIVTQVTRSPGLSDSTAAGRHKKCRRENREYCHIRAHEKPSGVDVVLNKIILARVDYQNKKLKRLRAGTALNTSLSRRPAQPSALRGGARYAACNS